MADEGDSGTDVVGDYEEVDGDYLRPPPEKRGLSSILQLFQLVKFANLLFSLIYYKNSTLGFVNIL